MIKRTIQLFGRIAPAVYLINMLICLPLVLLSFRIPQQTHVAFVTIYNCFTMILIQIVTIRAASALYNEESFTWKGVLQFSVTKYQRLLLYTLLYFFVSALGLLCFVVPSIIFALMAFFVTPLIILENLTIKAAWKRSREMTKGYRLRLLGHLALIMLFMFLFYFALGSLTAFDELVINRQPLFAKTLFRIIGYPIDCFATIWISTFITVAYYSRRNTYVKAQPAAT